MVAEVNPKEQVEITQSEGEVELKAAVERQRWDENRFQAEEKHA